MSHLASSIALFALALGLARAALAAPGPAGCDTGSWIAGSTEYLQRRVRLPRLRVRRLRRDRIGDPQAGSTGTLSRTDGNARYTADINSADLVALRLSIDGRTAPRALRAQHAARRELDGRRARDRHRRQCRDRRRHLGEPVRGRAAARHRHLRSCRSRRRAGTRSICSRPAIPRRTGSRGRSRCRRVPLARAGGDRHEVAARRDERRVPRRDRGPVRRTSSQTGLWFEERQATALTTGDISQFGAVVDVSKLLGRRHRARAGRVGLSRARLQLRLHDRRRVPAARSSTTRTRRVWTTSASRPAPRRSRSAFHFYGKNQPYGIYIPNQPGPHGMQLALHGYSAQSRQPDQQPGHAAERRRGAQPHRSSCRSDAVRRAGTTRSPRRTCST